MKSIGLISVFALLLVAVSTAFYISSKNTEKNAGVLASDASAVTIAALVHENAIYRQKITTLQQKNEQLMEQLRASQNAEASPQSPAQLKLDDQTVSESAADAPNYEQDQANVTSAMELTAYLSTFSARSPADIGNDVSNKFNRESIDYSWASGHETKLAAMFTESETLSEFVPEDISCKTTRCRVTVPAHNHEKSNQIMQHITHAMEKNTLGLEQTTVLTIPNPSTGFVDFYIARDSTVRLYQ